jgi:phenylacetate-CoA ligase
MVINMTELPLGGNKDNSIENLRRQQFILLQKQLERVYENSSFYRAKLNGAGLAPSDIQSMTDLTKIPLTTREELEKNFIDILAVSTSKIAHTKNDVNMIADASARRLTYHGATDKDVVQITSAYGLWQGAWSMHWGAEKIGACVLPIGPADTERQLLLIKQHGTTILYGATNYHFRILEVAKSLGEDLTKYNLKMAICVAEKPTAAQIDLLKSNAGYQKVISDYGATEFPGFSVNCKVDGERHHVWADYYLVEVVDPATHEPLQEGQKGELVITSLQREAFPLIRYLSRDITTYFGFENCACGLNHPMISANIDREDSMTKIRGVTVFPSHIEKILNNFPGITAKCQLIVDKHTPRHETIIKVETAQSLSPEQEKSLKAGIISEVKTRVGIGLNDVIFIPQNDLGNKFKKVVILE